MGMTWPTSVLPTRFERLPKSSAESRCALFNVSSSAGRCQPFAFFVACSFQRMHSASMWRSPTKSRIIRSARSR